MKMNFRQAAALIADATMPYNDATKARGYLKRPWVNHPGNQLPHTPGTLRALDMILAIDALSDSEAISSALKSLEMEIASKIAGACLSGDLTAFDEITGIRLSSLVGQQDYLIDFADARKALLGYEAICQSDNDGESSPAAAPALTPMQKKGIIEELGRKYPSLSNDFNRNEEWIKNCRTGKRGWYYSEQIKEGCRRKWGNADAGMSLMDSITRTHKIKG